MATVVMVGKLGPMGTRLDVADWSVTIESTIPNATYIAFQEMNMVIGGQF